MSSYISLVNTFNINVEQRLSRAPKGRPVPLSHRPTPSQHLHQLDVELEGGVGRDEPAARAPAAVR